MPAALSSAPSMVENEEAQVAQAKRDRQAFAPLYAHYFTRVYGYCYRRLGDAEEAADATSTVFARALAALPSCTDDRFRSWLFAIAHNVLADHWRGRLPDRPLDVAGEIADHAPSPEDLALAAERRQTVTQLLAQLAPDQRQIIELRLAGLTSKEIADALGRTPNAIDQAQFRAMTRLRTLSASPIATPEDPS